MFGILARVDGLAGRGYAGAMAKQGKKTRTAYQGVRYREHPTRKCGRVLDRYFYIRTYHNGKEREEGLGWASEGWTAQKAAGVLADIKAGQTIGKGPQNLAEAREVAKAERDRERQRRKAESVAAMPFCQAALDHYLPWARRHKASWKEDVSRFEIHLDPAFGAVPIRQLTRGHIEAMLDAAGRKGLAPATVQQCLALARRICNYCSVVTVHGESLLPGPNPCQGVVVRGPDNARLRFLTHAEADRLVDAACGLHEDNALQDMILLALHTGMRLGELQRLRRQDVDLAHDMVHVLDQDGKPGGVCYLNAKSRSAVERRLSREHSGSLLFAATRGNGFRENISQRFKELVDALGFNDGVVDPRQRVVFHSLRHTFASWLALAGTDIYHIKDLMRHKTITMTMRYAHLIPGAKRRAVQLLEPGGNPPGPRG
jgi:integrase